MAAPKLGILAGGGVLPRRLVDACRLAGREVFVVAFTGHTEPATTEGVPHVWTRLGAAGEWLERLHREGVSQLCMIGPVKRPSLREIMPDWRAARILARIGFNRIGDDALLQGIRSALEDEGFDFIGVHHVLTDLLTKPGALTKRLPDRTAQADIERALAVARANGALDVGQGAVVQQGVVLAVEAVEGTNAMLERCAALARPGPGGVLVKASKPQQDLRLDLPTVGVTTVEKAAAAGLRGIAAEAGGTLIVDPEAVAATADRLGLFVIGLEVEAEPAVPSGANGPRDAAPDQAPNAAAAPIAPGRRSAARRPAE